jgi:hypothetical protein
VRATIDIGKGEIKFDINSERSYFKFRPRHRRVSKEEPRKKEETKKKQAEEIKEVVASVKIKEQKPPVKTKKMTKPKNKSAPKMVRKWVPKIAIPAKSVDPK